MSRLNGKVCIVTGGAQGIGRAIAQLYASQGAKMVIVGDLQDTTFEQPNIRPEKLNTTNRTETEAFVKKIWEEFGQIDVIVNNAGITRDALCNKMTEEQWNLVIDVNLKGPHNMVAAAGPYLMEQGYGSIITMGSIIGLYGNIGQANYSATKAGVIAMSKTWTKELSRRGGKIRANVIAPGFISTPILDSMPEKIIDSMKEKVLFKELGNVSDVAYGALYLASDESSYVTGQVLEISGGISL